MGCHERGHRDRSIPGTRGGTGDGARPDRAGRSWWTGATRRPWTPQQTGSAPQATPGAQVVTVVGDITDEAHRHDLTAAAFELGGLDLVVNNAGTLGTSPLPSLADYPLDDLRIAFEVNVVAPLGARSRTRCRFCSTRRTRACST